MKRVLLCCLVLSLLTVPALAEEDPDLTEEITEAAPLEPVTIETTTSEEEGVTVNVTIQQTEAPASADSVEDASEGIPVDILEASEDPASVQTFTVFSVDDFSVLESLDDRPVMADVVTSVLGEYQRRTYTVQELDSDGNVIATSTQYVPGLAGLDYAWIAGAGFFALFLAGIFKLLGGLMRA